MDPKFWKTLLGGAKVVIGGAFVIEGLKTMRGEPSVALLGRPAGLGRFVERKVDAAGIPDYETPAEALQRPPGAVRWTKLATVNSIEERVSYLQKLARKASLDPKVKEAANRVLNRKCGDKWCVPQKNSVKEIEALFMACRNVRSPLAIRYVRDHVRVDQFAHPNTTRKLRGADCDDAAVYLGSMLMAVGYPIRFRVVQAKGSASWSHIYLLVGVPPTGPTRWIPLDLTVMKPPGWEVDGAEDAKLSGKPSGLIERTKDFDV